MILTELKVTHVDLNFISFSQKLLRGEEGEKERWQEGGGGWLLSEEGFLAIPGGTGWSC